MWTLELVEAVVEVEGEEIRYRRAGRGAPVLLLRAGSRPGGGEADPLFRALAGEHRVIEPLTPLPGTPDRMERWLRGLVEGLGLGAPEVMVEEAVAPLVAGFPGEGGGVVGPVVILRREEGDARPGRPASRR